MKRFLVSYGSPAGAELDADGIGLAGITPSGITADVRDHVLEGAGSEWRVIRWKRIGFVE